MNRSLVKALVAVAILGNSAITMAANQDNYEPIMPANVPLEKQVCLNEIANLNMPEALKKCSSEDVARTTVVLYELDRQIKSAQKEVKKAEDYLKSDKYKKDKKIVDTITYTGETLLLVPATIATFRLLVGAAQLAGVKALPKFKFYKKFDLALFVSYLIGSALLGVPEGSPEMWYSLKFHPEDLPRMQESLTTLQKDASSRRLFLEAVSKVHKAQAEAIQKP